MNDKEVEKSIETIKANIAKTARCDISYLLESINDLKNRVRKLEHQKRMTIIDVIRLLINIGNFVLFCILVYILSKINQ